MPDQQNQDPFAGIQNIPKPPGIGPALMGAIPFVGRGLYQHALNDYYSKLMQRESQVQQNRSLAEEIGNFATNANNRLGVTPDPDVQLEWQQLHGDVLMSLSKDPGKPLGKELGDRFRLLHGISQRQQMLNASQAQATTPPALAPPQGSPSGIPSPPPQAGIPGMMPQGSGPAQVNATPQGPATIPTPGINAATAPQGADPMADLQARASSPNPLISGPAKAQLTAMSLGLGQTQLLKDRLAAMGIDISKLPPEAVSDLMNNQGIRNLAPLKPGEVQPSVTGDIIAQSPVPRLESVAPGASLVSAPPQGPASVIASVPGKVAEGDIVPDPNAKITGWSRIMRDEVTGSERSRVPNVAPPAGMTPTAETSTGYKEVTQPDGTVALVPTTTTSTRRPILPGMPGRLGAGLPPSATPPADSGLPPGSFIAGARPLPPTQRERMDAQSNALDNTGQLIGSVINRLPLLNSLIDAGRIQLAASDGAGAQILSRAANLNPEETQLAADVDSLKEHINTLRGPLGATGFRGHEAFAALQVQRGKLLANPNLSRAILQNSLKSILGQRSALQRELAKTQGLKKPKLDPETAKLYVAVSGGDVSKAMKLATDQGYDISK